MVFSRVARSQLSTDRACEGSEGDLRAYFLKKNALFLKIFVCTFANIGKKPYLCPIKITNSRPAQVVKLCTKNMKTKFNKQGETVITLSEQETLIMAHVLKQFVCAAKYDEGLDEYFITDDIASVLTRDEYNDLREMWSKSFDAARAIMNR